MSDTVALSSTDVTCNVYLLKAITCVTGIDNVRRYGWTALHYAAVEGQFDIVELLLARGVDVRARDKDGVTAAFRAHAAGHHDVVCLMQSLADTDDLLLVVVDGDSTRPKQPPAESLYASVRKFTVTQNKTGDSAGSFAWNSLHVGARSAPTLRSVLTLYSAEAIIVPHRIL